MAWNAGPWRVRVRYHHSGGTARAGGGDDQHRRERHVTGQVEAGKRPLQKPQLQVHQQTGGEHEPAPLPGGQRTQASPGERREPPPHRLARDGTPS